MKTYSMFELSTGERFGASATLRHADGTVIAQDITASQAGHFFRTLHKHRASQGQDLAPTRHAMWALLGGAMIPQEILDQLNLKFTDRQPLPAGH